MQYRLTVLGYLALEDLRSDGPEAERRWGAYGFEDQKQALNWVHNTALALEGNESQIIILGPDAGAFSACFRIFSRCTSFDCTFAGARFTSSANTKLWKTGPRWK